MNIYADQLFVRAEIDRRLELFGVADQLHPQPTTGRGTTAGRLARRVGRALRPSRPGARTTTSATAAASGQPCHP